MTSPRRWSDARQSVESGEFFRVDFCYLLARVRDGVVLMNSRVVTVLLVFQGISLAALVFLSVAMYRLQSDVEAGEPVPTAAPDADVVAEPTRSPETDADKSGKSPQDADTDAALARRMETIEARIDDLLAQVEEGLRARTAGNAEPASVVEPLSREEHAELWAQADLIGRFSSEVGTSAWGEAASATIEEASSTAYADNPFFAEHGGQVSTECRETVCNLSWSPADSETSQLSDEEKAELLDRAKWELISLAAQADEAGQLRISLNPAASPPTIEVLVDRKPGGDPNVPDRVSEYLKMSDGVTKQADGR